MRHPIALLAMMATLLAGGAQAASFNCERTRKQDERDFCATLKLNDQDVRMAQLYDIAQHLVAVGGWAAILDDQPAWLKTRCIADRNKVLERA